MFVISIFGILVTVFIHSEAQVRIVGGKPAKQGDLPYQAFLYFFDKENEPGYMCSGTLISDEYILTAGHCVTSMTNPTELYNYVRILLGATDRIYYEEGQEIYEVSKEYFVRHPDYNNSTTQHDIALIELPELVSFSKYIQKADLPSRYQTEEDLLNKTIVTSGWGILHGFDFHNVPEILHYMKTKVVNGVECSKAFKSHNIEFYSNTQICINSPTSAFCDGDSGGPNVIRENGVNVVVGISSLASTSCELNTPQILTKVSYYLDWISENTGIVV